MNLKVKFCLLFYFRFEVWFCFIHSLIVYECN